MKYFEDFCVGHEETFGRYAVTAEEIVEFAGKYDPQPFHLDPEAARQSLFGTLCASGWHTCAMTMRMLTERMKETGELGHGSPGVEQIRWLRPVVPGDVLSVRVKVIGTRLSGSRPGFGLVTFDQKTVDAEGKPVMSLISTVFYSQRPA
ncbi:MaoC family dehydratase [Pedomonas mirosovicensis]|uniref:MaoC family dehydratase n=1 Tax=Pedomonas mirosovicensis TaxID=2908641 RepID=UPI0021699761|nr:MaoC family dehydratase [Pedomonas mirosovicensis]MCH8684684.1 MaoC family dehydratase [Pedomonas mirosovicensis]